MKKILFLFAAIGMTALTSCEGPEGPQGEPGYNVEAEVFELNNVNFSYDAEIGYNIYQTLTPNILDSDVILVYRLTDLIDSQTPIWQQIPRTLYVSEGEVDYDFDFSREDFQIYVGGTFNLGSLYTQGQTFRIVIIPGYFSKQANAVDLSDYNAVVKAYNIDESNIKQLTPTKK